MSVFKNQSGMTLTEVMLAVGMSGCLLYAVAMLLSQVSTGSNGLINTADFDNDLDRMEYLITRQMRLGTAVTTVPAGTSINTYSLTSTGATAGLGFLRPFDSTSVASALVNTTVNTVALFYREGTFIPTGATAVQRSVFYPTAVYFQQPQDTPATYGAMYIDEGSLTATSVNASKSKVMISPLTGISIAAADMDTWSSSGYNFVRSFKITVNTRLATTGASTGLVWCPPSAMNTGNCITKTPYKDISRTFIVKFVNNADPALSSTMSLLSGRIYYTK